MTIGRGHLQVEEDTAEYACSEIYKVITNSLQKLYHPSINNIKFLHQQSIPNTSNPKKKIINMKTSFIAIFLSGLIASSVATPATRLRRQAASAVCASGTPNCCDVDVLGIADLDCAVRKSSPQFPIKCSGKNDH